MSEPKNAPVLRVVDGETLDDVVPGRRPRIGIMGGTFDQFTTGILWRPQRSSISMTLTRLSLCQRASNLLRKTVR